MRKTTLALIAILATLALAVHAQAGILSNPASPSSGKYLRISDRAIFSYDKLAKTLTPSGWAPDGFLFSTSECVFQPDGTCESTGEAFHCYWRPGRGPWSMPQRHDDFDHGRCAAVRVRSDGASSVVEMRAAIRLAALRFDSNDLQGATGEWTYRLRVFWHDAATNAEMGYKNDTFGRQVNPTTIPLPLEPCRPSADPYDPALGPAYYLSDCVWTRTGETDPTLLFPAGLESCLEDIDGDGTLDCVPATVNGFTAYAEVYLNGSFVDSGGVYCSGCITPRVSPAPTPP